MGRHDAQVGLRDGASCGEPWEGDGEEMWALALSPMMKMLSHHSHVGEMMEVLNSVWSVSWSNGGTTVCTLPQTISHA